MAGYALQIAGKALTMVDPRFNFSAQSISPPHTQNMIALWLNPMCHRLINLKFKISRRAEMVFGDPDTFVLLVEAMVLSLASPLVLSCMQMATKSVKIIRYSPHLHGQSASG